MKILKSTTISLCEVKVVIYWLKVDGWIEKAIFMLALFLKPILIAVKYLYDSKA
jgi:hypothetical protein